MDEKWKNPTDEDLEKLEEYISEIFNLYQLDRDGLFEWINIETGEWEELALFTDEIDQETMDEIQLRTGFSKDELLSLDERIKHKYWNEYPFFKLNNSFFVETMLADRSPDDLLRVFLEEGHTPKSLRYNYSDILDRLKSKLKEIDETIPGTWHENAEMNHIEIQTENLISFPECRDLMKSFLQMVDDLGELFFKALKTNLSQAEQNKLNFLVNSMNVTDICMPMVKLTYDNILILRDVYRRENLSDFLSYANVRLLFDSNLWRCKEFFDDPELAQRFLNVIPDSKLKLRRFAMLVSKFDCTFTWSDAKPVVFSPEEELEMQSMDDYIPIENRRLEETEIWIEKNADEVGDWEPYILRLRKAAGSENLGGVKPPYREHGAFGPITLVDGVVTDRHRLRVDAWHTAPNAKPLI